MDLAALAVGMMQDRQPSAMTRDEPSRAAASGLRPSATKDWVRALEMTARIGDQPLRTLPRVVEELADRFGDAPAMLSQRECFSFAVLAERANRYARWALEQGLRPGETVCLMMPNRPEYMAIWLGITRVGGVVALLNTNLVGGALAHCIAIAAPIHLVVAAECLEAFDSAAAILTVQPRLWIHGEAGTEIHRRIDADVARCDGRPLDAADVAPVSVADRALLIYTSGTTGLPKAAGVSHHRVMMWSHWFAGMMQTGPADRMYDCLPMYHSVGGIVATGSVLVTGGSVVIRERFSVRRFWDDVVETDCSLFQYIGELCRYLLKAPPSERERQHRLRLCAGNGLRADVWTAFQARFAIPRVLEFYAATEGNFALYNAEGKPGAIGRIPSFMAHRFTAAIVKHDGETGQPARDDADFCIRCARNEVGEAIGRIAADASQLASRFEGYTSPAETEKKILRHVFVEGDAWMRTGDLMRLDSQGFFFFVDRIGDTFRWKGENVATFEVAEAIAGCPGVAEANVYGVAVPGTEGRAGMAALVVEEGFDPAVLRTHIAGRLPDYARPLFLRIRGALELTETFKQKKGELVREGFDPALIDEPLYFDDTAQGAYVPLDGALFARLAAEEIRV